ncbi:kinase-like protein [Phanerochaete sordida]|uniref:Kinase-like protein n=1 Tax=Phanerochaete sordida TaxID=48140 RepID=A0A9P3LJ99_9APHY|nr:kinase-like protein [Phanerochaete sordida]
MPGVKRLSPDEVYATSLASLGFGYPLWHPEPHVSGEPQIGDVGLLVQGQFIRLFHLDTTAADKQVTCHYRPFTDIEAGCWAAQWPLIDQIGTALLPAHYCNHGKKHLSSSTGSDRLSWTLGSNYPVDCTCQCHNQGTALTLRNEATAQMLHPSRWIKDYVIHRSPQWHVYATQVLGFEVRPDEIMVVTGWYKTTRDWSVTAFDGATTATLDTTGVDVVGVQSGDSLTRNAASSAHHRQGFTYLQVPDSSRRPHGDSKYVRKDQCIFVQGIKVQYRLVLFRGFPFITSNVRRVHGWPCGEDEATAEDTGDQSMRQRNGISDLSAPSISLFINATKESHELPEGSPTLVTSWFCPQCASFTFWHDDTARLHFRARHTFKQFPSCEEAIERLMVACRTYSPYVVQVGVYQHVTQILAERAYALKREEDNVAAKSYEALESVLSMDTRLVEMCTAERVLHTSRARKTIMQIAVELHVRRVDGEILTELEHDESIIMRSLQKLSEGEKSKILGLQGDDAKDVLDLFDSILRPQLATTAGIPFVQVVPSGDVSHDDASSLQRLFVRLCESSLQLPHRLWLSNVQRKSSHPEARGAYGEIYQGEYSGSLVALKALHVFAQMTDNVKHTKAFYREIALIRGLEHNHVCPIIGVDQELLPNSVCIVLPWMDYGNVVNYRSRVPWSCDDAVRLINQVSYGLAYLHSNKVVYGDLHVGNILVNASKDAVLVDFGLANFSDSGMSCSSATAGATRYMAPEILDHTRFNLEHTQHTPASDVYSLGQVSWRIYTEKDPFYTYKRSDAAGIAIRDGKIQDRASSERPIPDFLWETMLACWEYEPSKRVITAAEVRDRLRV